MNKFFNLKILGLERKLPILPAPSGILIAGFNPVGDMELLTKCAKNLYEKIKSEKIEFDILLTTELKGVPIAQEIARLSEKNYICLRKNRKFYMLDPIELNTQSITSGSGKYFISKPDCEILKGKKVLFVDDVFSTGSTFSHIIDFSKKFDFKVTAGMFILKETDTLENLSFNFLSTPVFCCEFLPLPK